MENSLEKMCTPVQYYKNQNVEYPYGDNTIVKFDNMDECDLIAQILACEASYYALRRILFGSDFLTPIYDLRTSLVLQYKEKYKKDYIEYNSDWHH